jgi:hypothetical protein
MRLWILVLIMIGIEEIAICQTVTGPSDYRLPVLPTDQYVEAAQAVLTYYLCERLPDQEANADRMDTLYVGYPEDANPPSGLLRCASHAHVILLPYSQFWQRSQGFIISPPQGMGTDTIRFSFAEMYPPAYAPPMMKSRANMGPRFGSAKLARTNGQWEVLRWKWEWMDY